MGELMSPRTVAPKAYLGLVPQDLAVYPDLTARENVEFFGRLYGMKGKELSSRAGEVLEVIGLTDRGDDRAKEFSGGMKRRLNIGIGLLHRPKLLILDEPTVGVDPQSRNAILESVEVLAGEGIAVLYTTHYMEEAERLCDRVAIIDEGKVKAEGTRRELVQLVGQNDRVSISGTGPLGQVALTLGKINGVTEATTHEQRVDLLVENASGRLPELLASAAAAGMSINGVDVEEPNLEAAFLHLTGKALRD
jgi:ABC-2 type transport system ATP-binding protein